MSKEIQELVSLIDDIENNNDSNDQENSEVNRKGQQIIKKALQHLENSNPEESLQLLSTILEEYEEHKLSETIEDQNLCELYYLRASSYYQLLRFDSSWNDLMISKNFGKTPNDLEERLTSYRYYIWKFSTFSLPFPFLKIGNGRVYFHWSILAFIGYLIYWIIMLRKTENIHSSYLTKLFLAIFCTLSFLFAVLIHEIAHGFVMFYFFKEKVAFIVVHILGGGTFPEGGVAIFRKNPKCEFWTAVSGPLINIFCGVLFFIPYINLIKSYEGNPIHNPFYFFLFFSLLIHFSLGIFNLLPALPMDGGRCVTALLQFCINYLLAVQFSSVIGIFLNILLFALAIYLKDYITLVMSIFFIFLCILNFTWAFYQKKEEQAQEEKV